ncbi:MAG: hypothetical protein RLZZ519_1269 [Bacteroidota bacterium]|jgi:hypothetical protein
MRYILSLLLLLLMTTGKLVAQDANPSIMEEILEAYLSKEFPPSKFELAYRIGDANSGLTTMKLNGKGRYKITSTVVSTGEFTKLKGRISEAQVEKLANTMVTMKLWEFKHIKPFAGNDEAIPSITVFFKNKSQKVACFSSEVRFSMPFYTAQEMILDIIRQESNNLILETGI